MKRFFLILALFFIVSACSKEEIPTTEALLINKWWKQKNISKNDIIIFNSNTVPFLEWYFNSDGSMTWRTESNDRLVYWRYIKSKKGEEILTFNFGGSSLLTKINVTKTFLTIKYSSYDSLNNESWTQHYFELL